MAQAKVAILLISANFLNSEFILSQEVPALLKRREREGLTIFPVIAKPCAWRTIDWLSNMQVRPQDGRPVWRDDGRYADEELAVLTEEVAATLSEVQSPIPEPPSRSLARRSLGGVIENPYVHRGKPIRSFQHFIGRRRELTQVTNDIRNGQCISVIGIRRIGKTSLLLQLLDPDARSAFQLTDDTLCVYIDCGRLAKLPADRVYAEIMHRVYRQLNQYRRVGWLAKPDETLGYHDFEEKLLTLRDAGMKLVLLLDEFERLGSNPHLDVSFFLGLRALHTEPGCELTYVTASRGPIMELAFSHEDVISSPFPNIFDSVRVGLFPEQEGRELIRMANLFSPEVEDFLLELTGGHPLAL